MFGAVGALMAVMFLLFLVLFGFAVVVIVRTLVRSRRVLADNGLDPYAAQAQLAAQVAHSQLLAPGKSLEQRLQELDDLRSRGVITEAEHATARDTALAEG